MKQSTPEGSHTLPTTVPVSASTVSTTTSTTVQPSSVLQYTNNVLTKPLCPIEELPDNNKENSSVSGECCP